MEIHGFVPITKPTEKRGQSVASSTITRSRDKNFRIMKKSVLDKKEEPFGVGNLGLMVVTGLGQQMGSSTTTQNVPPRFKSTMKTGSYR